MRIWILIMAMIAVSPNSAMAQPGPGGGGPDRDRMEQQLRERMGEVVQRRLDLNAQQVQQLRQSSQQFDRQRMALLVQERRVRMAIRHEIETGENGSQQKISALLDSTILLERRRLDLLEAEQKQLATFLTARQRAQYLGLQSQMRHHLDEMRRRREGRGGRVPPE